MSAIHSTGLGTSVRRREDPRLLKGLGAYVGDLDLPGTLHAAILRSPHATARISRIDLSAVRRAPGVIAALAYQDIAGWAKPIPQLVPYPGLESRTSPILASGVVRYVGEPIAIVVATDRYLAEDALERVHVEYEPLGPVVDAERALGAGSPVVHADTRSNLAARFGQTVGNVEEGKARATTTVQGTFRIGRVSGQPLEGRGVLARYEDRPGGGLTVWCSGQSPHTERRVLADQLELAQHQVRVIAPDIGGGFGVKNRYYPEETLVAHLAMRLGRPVKWIEDRRETFSASYHEREQIHRASMGFDEAGNILFLVDHFIHDQGAYTPFGVVVPWVTSIALLGPYRVPSFEVECRMVYTNKTPIAPYRGAGKPQGTFVTERLMDLGARAFARDPADLRRQNFLKPDEMPHDTGLIDRDGSRVCYDSGDYPALLDKTLAAIRYDHARAEQRQAAAEGRLVGVGLAAYVELTGRGPYEGATVRVEPSGEVVVMTGASSQGQGHRTTLAQICASVLGADASRVTVLEGDTGLIPLGIGTWASRTAVMAGSAVAIAARSVKEKVQAIVAKDLEVSPADIVVEHGRVGVRGVDESSTTLGALASRLNTLPRGHQVEPEVDPGLESTGYFRAATPVYASGMYAAVVEVDRESGDIRILRHALVHDCGTIINPAIVDGQIHGGVAQGLGTALYERVGYDETGQLTTSTYLDYLLPTSSETPNIATGHQETPCPLNPLGIKGAGEGGTMPVPPAINSAVEDALRQAGIDARLESTPIGPSLVRDLLRNAAG